MRGPPYVLGQPRSPTKAQVYMTPIITQAPARSATANKASKSVGSLPEWNLADLYPAMDAPAVKNDLDRGETECI